MQKILADDGVAEINNQPSEVRIVTLMRDNLPAGTYKIEFKANDDIITSGIASQQQYFSFINRVWLADARAADLTLYSNAPKISLQTINPASRQTALINGKPLALNTTYRQLSLASPELVKELKEHVVKKIATVETDLRLTMDN